MSLNRQNGFTLKRDLLPKMKLDQRLLNEARRAKELQIG